jgi:hypothetical protein
MSITSIQYILQRSQCLNIMKTFDGDVIKNAICSIMDEKEFPKILMKWEEISRNLTDVELEYVCKHIRDIFILKTNINSSESPFEKGKIFTSKLIETLKTRGVEVDFNTQVVIYELARKLEKNCCSSSN